MSRTALMSPERVRRILNRLAYQIVERNRGAGNVVLFGIRRRGTAIAERIAAQLAEIEGCPFRVHGLDVTAFRDDRDDDTTPAFDEDVADVTDRDVVLIDDVLFTGRTARAALDALVQLGRPRSIQFAVLIDRGHREYPIQPDYVGRTIPTKHKERIVVDVTEDCAVLVEE